MTIIAYKSCYLPKLAIRELKQLLEKTNFKKLWFKVYYPKSKLLRGIKMQNKT